VNDISKKYRRLRLRSFVIIWFVYGGYYLTRKNYAVCKSEIMDALHLDTQQIGWIGGVFLGMYAAGQILNGILGDKAGARITLSCGMLVSVLMSALFGFSSSLAMMIIVWGLNGYSQSTGWPGSIKSMSQWFSYRERGVIMGFWSTCYQIGGAASTLLASYILSRWGWRSAFFFPAALLFVIAISYILFHKDSPERCGLPPIDEFHGPKSKDDSANDGLTIETGAANVSSVPVFSQPAIWVLGAAYFCVKFVAYSLMFWLPLYMVKELGYSPGKAGYLSAAPEAAGFLGAIFAGYASDRLAGSRRAPVCALMLMALSAALFLQTKLGAARLAPMICGLFAVGFLLYGPETTMVGATAMDFGAKDGAATAAGFVNGCGSAGAAVQEPLLGFLAVRFGYEHFFNFAAVLTIIPALLMLIIWNVRPVKG